MTLDISGSWQWQRLALTYVWPALCHFFFGGVWRFQGFLINHFIPEADLIHYPSSPPAYVFSLSSGFLVGGTDVLELPVEFNN